MLEKHANTFNELKISESLIERLNKNNINSPTPVQSQAIPLIEQGKSLIFQSETGTGKTYAYLLPLLTKIESEENPSKAVRLAIIAPTFELASQIKTQLQKISDIKTVLLIGGAPVKRQIEMLKEKPSVVIGTPARLLDLFNLKKLKLDNLEGLVLDEVDRLISPEIRTYTLDFLKATKKNVQLIASSATITKSTQKLIEGTRVRADGTLSQQIETLFLPPEDVLKKRITHIALFAERRDKIDTLRKLLQAEKPSKCLVFTSKLDQVENIVSKLRFKGIDCASLHAKTDKTERKTAIDKFRNGKVKILVTSDLASRGLDIQDISHIVQMDLPSNEDFFIHRAGRTARAGKTGINIVIGDEYEMRKYSQLEKKLGITVYPKILYKGHLTTPDAENNKDSILQSKREIPVN